MRRISSVVVVSILFVVLLGCSEPEQSTEPIAPQAGEVSESPAGAEQVTPAVAAIEPQTWVNPDVARRGWRAAFEAAPNPLCDARGRGIVTLSWDTRGPGTIEIRVGAPDGQLFAKQGAVGSLKTGDWVSDGMKFYLQDVTGGKPATAENTLATVTAAVRKNC